jgi:hypothetical protein
MDFTGKPCSGVVANLFAEEGGTKESGTEVPTTVADSQKGVSGLSLLVIPMKIGIQLKSGFLFSQE